MKRIALFAIAALLVLGNSGVVRADWGRLGYSGYQPWYNIFAIGRRPKLTPEEERLQKFWHDYYDALHSYYGSLDHIDWVAYYKNHGYAINNGGGCGPGGCGMGGPAAFGGQRINYAPVIVTPNMTWAVPPQPLPGGPQPCGGAYTMPMGGYQGGYPGQMMAAQGQGGYYYPQQQGGY